MTTLESAAPGTMVPSGSLVSPGGGQGVQGIQGVQGSTWHNGVGPPPATGIPAGDYYLDTSTGDVYAIT
jgi:hypothetical protein